MGGEIGRVVRCVAGSPPPTPASNPSSSTPSVENISAWPPGVLCELAQDKEASGRHWPSGGRVGPAGLLHSRNEGTGEGWAGRKGREGEGGGGWGGGGKHLTFLACPFPAQPPTPLPSCSASPRTRTQITANGCLWSSLTPSSSTTLPPGRL